MLLVFVLVAAGCGNDDDDASEPAPAPATEAPAPAPTEAPAPAELVEVSLQLQWVPQSQFAGFFAARDLGFYEDVGLEVTIIDGAVDIVPATVLDSGAADFAISWVPRGLVPARRA